MNKGAKKKTSKRKQLNFRDELFSNHYRPTCELIACCGPIR